jgi:hypothetical protein
MKANVSMPKWGYYGYSKIANLRALRPQVLLPCRIVLVGSMWLSPQADRRSVALTSYCAREDSNL